MEISAFVEMINKFGPSIVLLGVALWGIYKAILVITSRADKSDDRVDKAIEAKDQAMMRQMDQTNEILQKFLDEKSQSKEEHTRGTQYRKNVIRKCHEFVKEIIEETGADKVTIYEYCNGSHNLSGIPFLGFKVIAEREVIKAQRIAYDNKMDISMLGTFLLDLERDNSITIKNVKSLETQYPELMYYMLLNKQYKGVFTNIVGVDYALGVLSITFGHNKKVDYANVEKIANKYTQKISNLLDYENLND